jgi:hypothetical protein
LKNLLSITDHVVMAAMPPDTVLSQSGARKYAIKYTTIPKNSPAKGCDNDLTDKVQLPRKGVYLVLKSLYLVANFSLHLPSE